MAIDYSKTIKRVQDSYKKTNPDIIDQIGLGTSLRAITDDPKDYVVMPSWYKEQYGVMGLVIGDIVQWAGEPDSGKTSLSLLAIKSAQDQGMGVIYVETEGKTGPEDLISAGIDPNGVMVVRSSITEIAFESSLKLWDSHFVDYPDVPLLYVFDSYGNTTSTRDSGISLTSEHQQVGGRAKVNGMGLQIIIAKLVKDRAAVLIVNRTYDNMGSPGKTNAGGKALNFHAMLTVQSSRVKWLEKTVSEELVRVGAEVKWNVYKNHYAKSLKNEDGEPILLPKASIMKITSDGILPKAVIK